MTVVSGPVVDTSGEGINGVLWARTGRPAHKPPPRPAQPAPHHPTKGDIA